jgi:hypothetical protein
MGLGQSAKEIQCMKHRKSSRKTAPAIEAQDISIRQI